MDSSYSSALPSPTAQQAPAPGSAWQHLHPATPRPVGPARFGAGSAAIGRGGTLGAVLGIVGLLAGVAGFVDAEHSRRQISSVQRAVTAQAGTLTALKARTDSAETALRSTSAQVTQVTQDEKHATDTRLDTAAVAKKVGPSVWTVEAGDYLGTAFAFSRTSAGETLLVTNFHVVAETYNAGGRSVGLKHGDSSYSGQIVAASEDDDLVAISVPATIPLLTRATGTPTVGDPVLSIGSPLGLSQTVTTGVVSALRDGMVQFSAPISPGNSGGPVIDRNGNVVGVAEKKYVGDGAEGLGFAISVATVCKTVVTC